MSTPTSFIFGAKDYDLIVPAVIPSKRHLAQTKNLARSLTVCAGFLLTMTTLVLAYQAYPDLLTAFWQRQNPLTFLAAFASAALVVSGTWYFSLDRKPLDLRNLPDQPHPYNLYQSFHGGLHDTLHQAASYATATGATEISDLHFLLALLDDPAIVNIAWRTEQVVDGLHAAVGDQLPTQPGSGHRGALPISAALHSRLIRASQIALYESFSEVRTRAVLLDYASTQNTDPLSILVQSYFSEDAVRAVTVWQEGIDQQRHELHAMQRNGQFRTRGTMNRAWSARPTPFLDQYSLDLTIRASYGYTRIRSGYTEEIEQVIATLAGGSQRNVIIIAEPDADAASILDSIATRIIQDKVPQTLHDVRLLKLDLTAFLASTAKPEQALQQALQEAADAGNVVLVIPDASLLSSTPGTSFDPAQIVGAAMRNHSIQLVALSTPTDYRKHIESQPILKSELLTVRLHTLTPAETIVHLETEIPLFEHQNKVLISYKALQKSAALGARYLPEVAPPGSALKLLEMAVKCLQNSAPIIMQKDVEAATEAITKAPVSIATGSEASALLNLEETLHQQIVGQSLAVSVVSSALRRSRSGLQAEGRPVGTFLFVGPTGVGKTELAKALTTLHYGDAEAMIRLDMSEYADPTAIYRLIGAPAGSAEAITDGGSLTQPLRERSYRLILLDELEKAHPNVLNLFLQILDDGRVTENTGRTVSFVNSIIIATSNAGARELGTLLQNVPAGTGTLPPEGYAILEKSFKPEFINRFDAIVPFLPLRPEEIEQIASQYLSAVVSKLAQQEYQVSFSPEAISEIARRGYDPNYGARPLRRLIERDVEGVLAEMILRGNLPKKSPYAVQSGDLFKS
jgi:ATP-dependent Clp protease ATP-binding subunit ClpC